MTSTPSTRRRPSGTIVSRAAAILFLLAVVAVRCSSAVLETTPERPVVDQATPPVAPAPRASPDASPTPSPDTAVTLPDEPVSAAPPALPLARDHELVQAGAAVQFVTPWSEPGSPTEVAQVVTRTEAVVRDPRSSDTERTAAAHEGQRAQRLLAAMPAWREEALAALAEPTRRAVTANLTARDALDRLTGNGDLPDALPAWEVVEPEPAEQLLQHYRDAGEAMGVDWTLLAGINLVETRMGRIVGFSTANARGPMQFIPPSWVAFGAGGDIDDARDSIFAAARHLAERPGSPPSDRNALFGYNNSVHYADAVLAYAQLLREDPDAYLGYHGWQVYFTTDAGPLLLPVGYREEQPVPLAEYLARPAVVVVG